MCLMVKADLKSFNTHDLWKELDKHALLKYISDIAKIVFQKLNIPIATCQYYVSLIRYYDRPRMKRINSQKIELYLLCYAFIRYSIVNDILIDTFRKRLAEIQNKTNDYINEQQLERIKTTHEQISTMVLMIDRSPSPYIPKKGIYKYVPQEEWQDAAFSLVDERFNKKRLFWKYIDSIEESIKLSIRALFLTFDFTIMQDNPLNTLVFRVALQNPQKCTI